VCPAQLILRQRTYGKPSPMSRPSTSFRKSSKLAEHYRNTLKPCHCPSSTMAVSSGLSGQDVGSIDTGCGVQVKRAIKTRGVFPEHSQGRDRRDIGLWVWSNLPARPLGQLFEHPVPIPLSALGGSCMRTGLQPSKRSGFLRWSRRADRSRFTWLTASDSSFFGLDAGGV